MRSDTTTLSAIFWDFDGVLLNSNAVRDRGFAEILNEFPDEQVEKLLTFHRRNGGLSRYVKFRYFFEEIRGESITKEAINEWAEQFSVIMRRLLVDPGLLIGETVRYVRQRYTELPMYIVSGSDQEELRYLCAQLGIASYFQRIHGSPTAKKEWVARILAEEKHPPHCCLLVGDSVNDWEAASVNSIHFMGYNNDSLHAKTTLSLDLRV